MSQTKLLLVEDDPNLGQILKEYLEIKGFQVTLSVDGVEGLVEFNKNSFDLCILDVMMPKKDGFTLAKEIHKLDKNTPFIFLTAKSLKDDAIEGLKIGADDYITKPFSMEELLLRINAILKRTLNPVLNQETYSIGQFTFESNLNKLSFNGDVQKLTSKESQLLELFCQNLNQSISRSSALKLIWGDDTYFNARSMDVYIAKLRKILKKDESLQIITVHGQGFKLVKIN